MRPLIWFSPPLIEGTSGQLFVKKMPACKIVDLAKAMAKAITGREDYPIKKVGIRPGKKSMRY